MDVCMEYIVYDVNVEEGTVTQKWCGGQNWKGILSEQMPLVFK